jgi:hypothetical protein
MNIFGDFETNNKINISIEYFKDTCQGDNLWCDTKNCCVKLKISLGIWHNHEDMKPFLELD